MTTALITGITGFVASHLAEYLLEHTDWTIYGTMRWDDKQDNLESLVDRINRGDRVRIYNADLTDAGSMKRAVTGMNYIFHLAAQSYPKTSFDIPVETLNTNIIGTLNLLEAVRHNMPTAWVHICSSSEVYGQTPKEYLPIKENCPFHPASPYAVSKIGTDMLGQYYAQAYNLRTVITRMFTHTGPRRGDVFFESSFAKQIAMIEAGMLEPPIKVGNLESLRTIADVRDAVRAYHMALTVNPVAGEVYNIGGTMVRKVSEVLSDLITLAGCQYPIEIDGSRMRPVDADLQVPDCSKFMEHTGWEPQIPYNKTLTDLLEYWRDRVTKVRPLQR